MTNLSKLGKLISVDLWSAEAGLYIFLLVDLLQAQQEFVICVEALCHDRRTAKREIVSNAGREHAKSLRVYPCLGPSNLSATRILQNNKSCRLSVPCCRILQNIKCRPSVLCRRVSRAARGRPAGRPDQRYLIAIYMGKRAAHRSCMPGPTWNPISLCRRYARIYAFVHMLCRLRASVGVKREQLPAQALPAGEAKGRPRRQRENERGRPGVRFACSMCRGLPLFSLLPSMK